MSIELKIPAVGESITEVEIGDWLKKEGEFVDKDKPVAVIETEKATVELLAPVSGTISKLLKKKGATAKVGEVVGYLESGEAKATGNTETKKEAPKAEAKATKPVETESIKVKAPSPAPETAKPSLPGGRLAKKELEVAAFQETVAAKPVVGSRQEEVVRMSKLRRTVAERLVQAQHTAAILTTFNEIDMSSIMALRKEHGEAFLKRYGTKLGFMSFFIKAVIDGLKQVPQLNAEIRDENIVYKNFHDIGVAIGGGKGLVVPVLRNAERMSFSELEIAISDFGARARENTLKIEELQGGTFTISNGGVYGSLLSTPIINPPQSGVLGMHSIQERPVAINGAVVIRPMMYVALSYDHRIVDGKEAVTFLKRVKDAVENPTRMLIEI